MNSQVGTPEAEPTENSRKGLWDILQKAPACDISADCAVPEPEIALQKQDLEQEQGEKQIQQLAEPSPSDARELPEAKLLKQLSEMTHLLEQQTTILYAQQKLLEDLTGRQKKPVKRKPGMAKKLKSLIHKGKIIWSAL
ncbi:hypothetical protein AXX12_16765 [Anaerosporomusa subterranea]|uniref:Uncharacterized protein n=1 Tax=Anaerosporomusa subterranea TaxID=1794912 RepID=A0A154BVB4_ANASB|nr:hypothetical protein [Anaerosporomusa subterranea]KYZ77916.1 hypothetical protein AXX12_16765 [Anaerosporomusa subterranea]